MAPFASSAEVFTWMSRFINLEQGQKPGSFRPERMEIIAALAGNPEKAAPLIHTAGSKGKGSVTGMISAVLEAGGLRPARYLSPHVTEYRERITQGDRFFDEAVYREAGNELRGIAETLKDRGKSEYRIFHGGENNGPTFFELLTLYFFLCARLARCRSMAVETGMGGRLDPTNIADPLVSIITVIELEHTEFLGDTIAAVAGEKAGIIKPRRPLVLAEQAPEALEVFKKTAAAKEAPLYYFPDTAAVKNLRVHRGGTDFTLIFKQPGFFPAPLDLSLSVPGEVQAQNAGLAVLALKTAFPRIGADTIRRGLEGFTLPARFERVRQDPPVIVDGAHTPASAELCVKTFTALYGEGGILLFGCAAGKNAEAMAGILLPHFSRVIITTPGTYKISEPEKVYRIFAALASGGLTPEQTGHEKRQGSPVIFMEETEKAAEYALALGRERELPVLGTGSFYLASEIRKLV
jgi:dihydrofolate synthase/folylpolyglutamate synthase